MPNALEINGLNKKYRNSRGVFDINLSIGEGEVYGFLGPNGSGKTTTMKIIAGLLRPDSGTVKIMGNDINDSFEEAMRNMGCLFESIVHYDYLSAEDNLKQAARFFPETDADSRIAEVLELVGLERNRRDKVSTFSLGMRQRLALAGCIYHRPRFLMLDEPMNGLDIEGVVAIRNVILDMVKNGAACFISSHMSSEIQKTCGKVSVITDGRIISTGYLKDILQKHESVEDYFISVVRPQEVQ